MTEHRYPITVRWTNSTGTGTTSYRAYSRDHEIRAGEKPMIPGSSDPNFRGDPARWNPEDLMVAAVSACHKLWYLHLCSRAGIVVTAYEDQAEGVMLMGSEEPGRFTSVTLRPDIRISDAARIKDAMALHDEAHHQCFIANSINFPVTVEATIGEST